MSTEIVCGSRLKRKNAFRQRLQDFEGKCCFCGKESELTLEHFFPKSKGGKEILSNYAVSCSYCNSNKGNKHPYEWFSRHQQWDSTRWEYILKILNLTHEEVITTLC